MDGLELYVLGRTLMKLGEAAITRAGFSELPPSVRLVLGDVFENPATSIGEIAGRTGFPQSHVSAAVAQLVNGGAFVRAADPADRRRTLVSPSPRLIALAGDAGDDAPVPVDNVIAQASGTADPQVQAELARALELLAEYLPASAVSEARRSAPRSRRLMT